MTTGHAAIVALAFVYVATTAFWWCDAQPWRWMDSATYNGVFKLVIWVTPAILVAMALDGTRLNAALSDLGLTAQPLSGLTFGLIATLPMAVAAAVSGLARTTPDYLLGVAVLGPFAEEVLFRGFLFRQLLRRALWPVGWAVTVSAVAFGVAHMDAMMFGENGAMRAFLVLGVAFLKGDLFAQLYGPQFLRLGQIMAGAIVVPAIGGAIFGWIFYRTGSLWPGVGLHACLNLWSTLAHRDSVMRIASSADSTSIAQGISLVLALLLVEWQWRRRRHVASISVPRP